MFEHLLANNDKEFRKQCADYINTYGKSIELFTLKEGERWHKPAVYGAINLDKTAAVVLADGTIWDFVLCKQRPAVTSMELIALKNTALTMDAMAAVHPGDTKSLGQSIKAAAEESVFAEAEKIIYGDREETYGHPAKNLENIAAQWSLFIQQKYQLPVTLNAHDVCWMMADLKKCREINKPKRDNKVDAVGYIGLSQRILDWEKHNERS